METPLIVGIRFRRVTKIYHFEANYLQDFKVGDYAVVATARGRQLGEVVQVLTSPPEPPPDGWKPVERKANARDLVLRQVWEEKEAEATLLCRQKAKEMRISDAKIIAAEFTFDGYRLSLLYSCDDEAKPRLDDLRNEMQRVYPSVRVEMRMLGPRDVAKTLGGMGSCGLETRCCSKFLVNFSPVSVKMAKAQQISLTSMEITGMCGRLRCCMVYEYSHYEPTQKKMPKRGKRVFTPKGEGKVVTLYPLKNSILVEQADGSYHEFPLEDVVSWSEEEAQRRLVEVEKVPPNPKPEPIKTETRNQHPASPQTVEPRNSRNKKNHRYFKKHPKNSNKNNPQGGQPPPKVG